MAEGSKTEKATPKKRRDERKKGNIFKSQDIITVISLLGSFYALKYFAPVMLENSSSFLLECITYVRDIESLSNEQAGHILVRLCIASAKSIVPILMTAFALGIITTGIQTKFLFTGKNAAPKFSRMNPLEGIKKIISLKSIVELLKNLIKTTILFVIIYQFVEARLGEMARTMDMGLEASTIYMFKEIMDLIMLVSMWFVAIAGFDYFYQWWDYERQLKMSKEEIKEEYKQLEGDPKVKGKIKEIQRQRARQRMMQQVPQADVIIRNPTHYAVALKYDFSTYRAPVVIAKGQDNIALKIIEIAEANHVQVVENRPLARALYSTCEINQEISEEYYGMVAEILVVVYKLNNKEIK